MDYLLRCLLFYYFNFTYGSLMVEYSPLVRFDFQSSYTKDF